MLDANRFKVRQPRSKCARTRAQEHCDERLNMYTKFSFLWQGGKGSRALIGALAALPRLSKLRFGSLFYYVLLFHTPLLG
jgi:hypothetical protein